MSAMQLKPVRRAHVQGLTLVEMMVAMAIALALVAAVSMLFLNTRVSQRTTDERSQMRETGMQALEILGRQITNTGFYPRLSEEAGTATGAPLQGGLPDFAAGLQNTYAAAGRAVPATLSSGLFGCSGQMLKNDLSGCDAVDDSDADAMGRSDSDAIMVAYFTSDAMSSDVGWRTDCGRRDLDNATINAARVQANTGYTTSAVARNVPRGLPPALPLLGINQYFLHKVTVLNDAGQSVTTYELACRGNGNPDSVATNGLVMVSLLPGIEQMVIRYGLLDATTGNLTYVAASSVGANDWAQVRAAQVCVMVRNLSAAVARASGQTPRDCLGNALSLTGNAGVRETYTRTFALKNRLGATVSGNL